MLLCMQLASSIIPSPKWDNREHVNFAALTASTQSNFHPRAAEGQTDEDEDEGRIVNLAAEKFATVVLVPSAAASCSGRESGKA